MEKIADQPNPFTANTSPQDSISSIKEEISSLRTTFHEKFLKLEKNQEMIISMLTLLTPSNNFLNQDPSSEEPEPTQKVIYQIPPKDDSDEIINPFQEEILNFNNHIAEKTFSIVEKINMLDDHKKEMEKEKKIWKENRRRKLLKRYL